MIFKQVYFTHSWDPNRKKKLEKFDSEIFVYICIHKKKKKKRKKKKIKWNIYLVKYTHNFKI